MDLHLKVPISCHIYIYEPLDIAAPASMTKTEPA